MDHSAHFQMDHSSGGTHDAMVAVPEAASGMGAHAHHMMSIDISDGLMISLLLAGLIGGFTHCVGMCGPFVMAQTSARVDCGGGKCEGGDENDSQSTDCKRSDFFMKRLADSALLPYHLGRITTYVGLAIVISGLANVTLLQSPYKSMIAALFLAIAGSMFIVSAVPALAKVLPFLKSVRVPNFLTQGLAKFARPFFMDPRGMRGYVLGLLLGFIPCGMVMAALVAVAASGSMVTAAMAMGLFGLGTVPALFVVGAGSRTLQGLWPRIIQPVSKTVMALNGVMLCVMAGGLVL